MELPIVLSFILHWGFIFWIIWFLLSKLHEARSDNLRLSNLVTKFDTALRTIATEAGMTDAFTGIDCDPECKPLVDRVKELKELADMYVGLL